MHAAIVREMGEVDILYNNAADEGTIMGLQGRIEDVNLDEMESCWRVNAGAAFLVRPTHIAVIVSHYFHLLHVRLFTDTRICSLRNSRCQLWRAQGTVVSCSVHRSLQ